MQRSDQKGTALTLAETQLELYRNLAFADVRLDDAAWSSSPLTSATDPYFTAHTSDSTIPSGAEAGEVVDTGTGINACAATPPPECEPVRTVTGPDHRRYRIDTYITPSATTSDGTSGGTVVGNPTRQITVVVRNAELPNLPILARNTSTFSDINAASFGGKSYPNLTLSVPLAWVTGTSGTSIPASSIGVAVSNGLYPLTSGSTTGTLTIYVYQGASAPSAPCGSGAGWTQVGTATVNNGNVTVLLRRCRDGRSREYILVVGAFQRGLLEQRTKLALQPGHDDDKSAGEQVDPFDLRDRTFCGDDRGADRRLELHGDADQLFAGRDRDDPHQVCVGCECAVILSDWNRAWHDFRDGRRRVQPGERVHAFGRHLLLVGHL